MSKGNKRAKEKLIELYGAECFIDKLGLRPEKNRKYTGKKQHEKMKMLTYHHIREKSKGRTSNSRKRSIIISRKSSMV